MLNNYVRKLRHCCLAIIALVLINACGWHLRGVLDLPEGLNSVFLVNQARSLEISETLQDLLHSNNVTLSTSISDAQIIINLEKFSQNRQIATLNSSGRVSEYELTSELTYSIEDKNGNPLVAPSSVASVSRIYKYDENNVIASSSEQRILQQEMRGELAQQVLRRLRFIDFSKQESQ